MVIKEDWTRPNGQAGRRFAWQLSPADTILLFDEVHMTKGAGTLNQALLTNAIRQKFPIICISGTLASDPTHMRATGRVVGLHKGGTDYMRFLEENGCVGKDDNWKFCGGIRGRRILANINRTVFPTRGARTRIIDLGDRFPETQILAEAYETGETRQIAAAFAEAERIIEAERARGASASSIALLEMKSWQEAWQQSEWCKIPALCEMTEREIAEGRSVVIFVSFTRTRVELMRRLRTGCAIFGKQPPHHREACIADFQADRARVLVSQIEAGGVGISLHDLHGNHPRTAFILPSTKVVSIKQALGRVHRAGGLSRSRQVIFFAAGTIEEDILRGIRAKMGNIDALNDGDILVKHKF